jgi:hypothetical protein
MGKFGNSFKREMGKNTGKFVRDLIFGDMHSTPYRRVGASQSHELRKEAAEMRHEREMERIRAGNNRKEQTQLAKAKHILIKNK